MHALASPASGGSALFSFNVNSIERAPPTPLLGIHLCPLGRPPRYTTAKDGGSVENTGAFFDTFILNIKTGHSCECPALIATHLTVGLYSFA